MIKKLGLDEEGGWIWRGNSKSLPAKFCEYVIGISGAKCLRYIKFKDFKFCKHHEGKPEKQFIKKGKRFRGNSKFQSEILGYKSTIE